MWAQWRVEEKEAARRDIKLRICATDKEGVEWDGTMKKGEAGDESAPTASAGEGGDEAMPWAKRPAPKVNEGSNKAKTMKEAIINDKLSLKVQVISARNLKIGDKKSQSSDPYVVIKVQGRKKTTQVKEKTLEPEWNETFELNKPKLKTKGNILLTVDVGIR